MDIHEQRKGLKEIQDQEQHGTDFEIISSVSISLFILIDTFYVLFMHRALRSRHVQKIRHSLQNANHSIELEIRQMCF